MLFSPQRFGALPAGIVESREWHTFTWHVVFLVVQQLQQQLRCAIKQLKARQLIFASKWLAELLYSNCSNNNTASANSSHAAATVQQWMSYDLVPSDQEADTILFAQSLFDSRELLYCAQVLNGCQSSLAVFLRGYARFLVS